MKISCVFAVITLSTVVNGAWWVNAFQPIVLSFGATFAALNLDFQPLLDVDWKNLLILRKDIEEPKEENKEENPVQPEEDLVLAKGDFIEELKKRKKLNEKI